MGALSPGRRVYLVLGDVYLVPGGVLSPGGALSSREVYLVWGDVLSSGGCT